MEDASESENDVYGKKMVEFYSKKCDKRVI